MFDNRKITIKIKTGNTHIVIPDVEIFYWADYSGYDFYNDCDIESFQLTELLMPPWSECFREKVKKYILENMNKVHKTRKGDVINVD